MVTACIGDIASHLGCTISLKDSVTAIAIVALGTSVPGNLAAAERSGYSRGLPLTWCNSFTTDQENVFFFYVSYDVTVMSIRIIGRQTWGSSRTSVVQVIV